MVRVAVTGLGPVSSIGIGVPAFTEGLRDGRSGISPDHQLRRRPAFRTATPARSRTSSPPSTCRSWIRPSGAGPACSRPQRRPAGRRRRRAGPGPELEPGRAHAVIGTTSGESARWQRRLTAWRRGRLRGLDGPGAARPDAGLPAGRTRSAEELGLQGEVAHHRHRLLGQQLRDRLRLRRWFAPARPTCVIAGGADSVCRFAHAGFYRLGALAEDVCSPFDADRAGILTGEGGAALLLESFEHAEARGARIYAEMLGYGLNCDANHPVSPERASIAECMRHRAPPMPASSRRRWTTSARTAPGRWPTTSSRPHAVRDVFGPNPPPISSIKSMIGHTMGAASGFGAIACGAGDRPRASCRRRSTWRNLDPELEPAWTRCRTAPGRPTVRIAQNNGFAFGGNNAIVDAGERCDERRSSIAGWSALTSAGSGADALTEHRPVQVGDAGGPGPVSRSASCTTEPLPSTDRPRDGRLQRPGSSWAARAPVPSTGPPRWRWWLPGRRCARRRWTSTTAPGDGSGWRWAPAWAAIKSARSELAAAKRWCRNGPIWSTRCCSPTP